MADDPLCMAFRGLQAFQVLFTLPIQMHPVAMLEDEHFPGYPTLTRLFNVVLVSGVAIAIPRMADVLSIIGGVGMTTAGIVVPTLMWIGYYGGAQQLMPGRLAFMVCIVSISVVLGTWATVLSVENLVT
eukprot:TRINITY_DN3198_c0_g1_i2.p1 TRINITY_DN3198_c0_g1~~TRINITY_DN3198_c0_g1_i2.p1  ORF type:complete len:129 (+),score=18.55 TRINITY_DN3198_c0_g1_i2:267-653(+)